MPVPFAMRSVNAWLALGPDGPDLLDCGPCTPEAWDALVAGLAGHGVAPRDVRRVVLTHGHVDHYGNAARLRRESPDLEVLVHPADRAAIEDYEGARVARKEVYAAALERCGLSEKEMRRLDRGYDALSAMGEGARVDGDVPADGEVEIAGARWRTLHVPGHSPGCVAFLRDGVLVSGDVLLEKVTTNAVNLAPDEQDALRLHRESLRRLASTGAGRVLPGHRAPFGDARAVAGEHLANIAGRAERVAELLGPEPQSVRALVGGLFRDLDVDLFLACSELLGHLRELERGGCAVERSDGRWTAP